MAPQLKVLLPKAGQSYPPTEPCAVNSATPIPIKTDTFEGEISVWVKDYNGLKKQGDGDEYFGVRTGNTYALVVRGRFLQKTSADDIIFGNVFEKEIASKLPWGTSIGVKFVNWIDPNVKMDLYSDKPWALGPALASWNYLSLKPLSSSPKYPSSSPTTVTESVAPALNKFLKANDEEDEELDWGEGTKEAGAARKKWFASEENRKELILDENVEVAMEFGNGLLDFNTLSVVLPPPFSLHLNLASYWDGQPATYTCCSKDRKTTYWSMAFQIIEADKEAAAAEAKPKETGEGKDEEAEVKKIEEKLEVGEGEGASDDVD